MNVQSQHYKISFYYFYFHNHFIDLPSDWLNSLSFTAPVAMETHLIMKNNAMFLLELSSGSPKRIGSQKETPPDMNSCFPPPGPFQCLLSLGVNPSSLREDIHFPQDEVHIMNNK